MLIWDSDEAEYRRATYEEVEDKIEAFHCDGWRVILWLTPNEARLLLEQRQTEFPGGGL